MPVTFASTIERSANPLALGALLLCLGASCGPSNGGTPLATCAVTLEGGGIQSQVSDMLTVDLGCAAGAGIAEHLSRGATIHTVGSDSSVPLPVLSASGNGSQLQFQLPATATGWQVVELDLRDALHSFELRQPIDVDGRRALAVLHRQSSLTIGAADALVTRAEGAFLELTFSEPALSTDLITKVSVVPSVGTCSAPIAGRDYDEPSSRILRIPCGSAAGLSRARLTIEGGLRSAADSLFTTIDGEAGLTATLGPLPENALGRMRLYTQSPAAP